MLGRFAWLWFNEEVSFESLLARIILCHIQESTKVIEFAFHVGVQQGHITLTATPEYIVFSTQCNGCVECILHLRSCPAQYLEIRIRSSTIHISWIRKYIRCSPE